MGVYLCVWVYVCVLLGTYEGSNPECDCVKLGFGRQLGLESESSINSLSALNREKCRQ